VTDDFNVSGERINTVKKNTETLLAVNKEADLEINAEKTKCTFKFCH
jgi:hypothetical protein